jgi:hypothetical protein
MTSTDGHRFAQASWHLIREFAGIYGVKMDYSVFSIISAFTIADAVRYSRTMNPFVISAEKYFNSPMAWKGFLMKRISDGYKSRKFYEEIAQRILFKDIAWRSQNTHLIKLKDGAEERIRAKRWARLKAKQAKMDHI